jgi:hypothetical protein
MPKCVATKKNKEPCSLEAVYSDNKCWAHSIHTEESRRQGNSRGGRNRAGNGELSEIKTRLKNLIDDVLTGAVERGPGAVAMQGYAVLLRAFEIERRVRESDEGCAMMEESRNRLEAARNVNFDEGS